MTYNAATLPQVEPMMIRAITPLGLVASIGGVLMFSEYDVKDVGMAETRNEWDEDVVDCSHRIFEITTRMMIMDSSRPFNFTVFPSRRWRNCRTGLESFDEALFEDICEGRVPLLYLGNPVRLFSDPKEGITVVRIPEFLIKSGPQLGY